MKYDHNEINAVTLDLIGMTRQATIISQIMTMSTSVISCINAMKVRVENSKPFNSDGSSMLFEENLAGIRKIYDEYKVVTIEGSRKIIIDTIREKYTSGDLDLSNGDVEEYLKELEDTYKRYDEDLLSRLDKALDVYEYLLDEYKKLEVFFNKAPIDLETCAVAGNA